MSRDDDQLDEFAALPAPPKLVQLELAAAYQADPHPNKVTLAVGAYRDEQGRPWLLPSFQEAERRILASKSHNHEYLPFSGHKPFMQHAQRLTFGTHHDSLADRIATIPTIGGSGAVHLGALFLRRFADRGNVTLIPDETWENHEAMLSHIGWDVGTYSYWDARKRGLDFESLCRDLRRATDRTVVLLHACGHNPTGCDPSPEQWEELAQLFLDKGHYAFFDNAYQGFVSGDFEKDGEGIRTFVKHDVPLLVAQSFSKNAGLYGERLGALHILCRSSKTASKVSAQLAGMVRREYSSSARYGTELLCGVCDDPVLLKGWMDDIGRMAGRIEDARQSLVRALVELETPGDWSHLTAQRGMFGFTGLTPAQCAAMVSKHHIYLLPTGRISIAGINPGNVQYIARAIDDVVRNA